MKDGNVYWSRQGLEQDHTTAHILAVGDSWFWYPMPGGSLVKHVGNLVAPRQFNILVAGHSGAEAYDYVKGKYKRQVSEMLRLYGDAAIALLVSGGGNDFAGLNDLRPLLEDDCAAAATAASCFRPGSDEGTLGWLMQRTYENLAILISRALFVLPATSPILVHSYDYAVPDGRGVFGGSAWLKPALDEAGVPQALQADCIRYLIDRLHAMLVGLAAGSGGRVQVVDSRGLLTHAQWANELHPRPAGFRKIAQRAWQPVLAQAGIA